MRNLAWSLLAVVVWAGAANWCPAQSELKPLATVSFSGYDKLIANIGMIGELDGNPDLGKALEMLFRVMTVQGRPLAGLDTKRPWGAVLLTDGQAKFVPYGFLPVDDLKKLVKLLQGNPQLGKIDEDNGVYTLQTGGVTVVVTQKGQWAVIAHSADDLPNAPADPAKLLGDLPGKYDLAVRLSVRNVPRQYRDYVLAQMQAGVQSGLEQLPSESDDEHALRSNMAQQFMQQMTTMVNELDELLIGWNVDHSSKSTYLDIEVTARAGTQLAKQFARVKKGRTNFAAFHSSKAAIHGSWSGTLEDADVAQAKLALTDLRKRGAEELKKQELADKQAQVATQVFNDAFDILEKTVEAKKIDGGLALQLDSQTITLVAGCLIADGAKLESLLKQLVRELGKDDPVFGLVKLDAETYEGVRFHTLGLPSPDEHITPFVGDTLDMVVGIANDRMFVAAGRDAVAALKNVIDQSKADSAKEVLPMQISVAVGPIAKFAAEMADEEDAKAQATMLADALKDAGGKDHVLLNSTPINNGFRLRLEVEEGLLKLLGSTGQTIMSGGNQ